MSALSYPLSATTANDHRAAVFLLQGCRAAAELRQIHGQMVKHDLLSHTLVASRLISVCPLLEGSNERECLLLYAQMVAFIGEIQGLEFSLPSVLRSCGKASRLEEGRQVHAQVLKTYFYDDPFVSNSILRMYLDHGEIEYARTVFNTMPQRDVISWNSMISGCFKAREIELAYRLFDEMPHKDAVSINAMVDGLMKSGNCHLARQFFENADERDVVTWTSMISGYVLNGNPKNALELFREMLCSGIAPDIPAIVVTLSAIADLGFSDEGKWIHALVCRSSMSLASGNLASAFIEMYSKCGLIDIAFAIFQKISHRRRPGDWNSMISGLAFHGRGRDVLKLFHEMLKMKLNPDEVTFLAVLKACSHNGLVDESLRYFQTMREKFKIVPTIKHYGCLVDLLGRAGWLEHAHRIVNEMPMEPDSMVWKSLLSSCLNHESVAIGELAFMNAIELAPQDSSIYVLLSNLYAKVGKWSDVNGIRALMKARGVSKNPGCSSVMIGGRIHEFLAGKVMDVKYREAVHTKLEEVTCRLKTEGYEPDLSQILADLGDEEKESSLGVHSEKLAIAFGLVSLEKRATIHIVKNIRVCRDCHSFIKLFSRVYKRDIVLRDQNRFHHFKGGSCSCNEYW